VNPLVFLDELEMQKGEEKSVTESEKISDTLPSNTVVVHEIELANNLSRATIFSDVPGNHTYAQAIRYLSEQGIAQGNGGKFFPENSVTR
jgi:ribosome-binding factor A